MGTNTSSTGTWAVIAALVIVGGCAILNHLGDGETRPSDIGAMQACETFVERQLRAPATASFPAARDADISRSGDRFTVRAHVDAENAFGATVRTRFECETWPDGDGWRGRATLLD